MMAVDDLVPNESKPKSPPKPQQAQTPPDKTQSAKPQPAKTPRKSPAPKILTLPECDPPANDASIRPAPAKCAKSAGRPKAATTLVREALQAAFEGMGGVEALTAWAEANPKEFYSLYIKLLSLQSKDGECGNLVIQWQK